MEWNGKAIYWRWGLESKESIYAWRLTSRYVGVARQGQSVNLREQTSDVWCSKGYGRLN